MQATLHWDGITVCVLVALEEVTGEIRSTH